MNDYETFREALRDVLNHLHDPDYTVSPGVAEVVAGGPHVTTSSVQYAIIEAIRELAPPPDTPESALMTRRHRILTYRFVEGLTQIRTAEQLHTTVRNIRREQHVAIHILARHLWERQGPQDLPGVTALSHSEAVSDQPSSTLSEWRTQARQDLAALRQSNPSAVADIGAVVNRAVALEEPLAEAAGIQLAIGVIDDGLTAAAHPAVLRQVLIMALDRLIQHGETSEVRLAARSAGGNAALELCSVGCCTDPLEDMVTAEMLQLLGGTLKTVAADEGMYVEIRIPTVGQVNAVVVDDNEDFVHFCRRCARGTRFRILQPEDWTTEAIQAVEPDVILLDIMLPYVDGWELLEALQHDPATADVPVVICSIARESSLASQMGAVEFLPKPISHQDLLATLERVTARES